MSVLTENVEQAVGTGVGTLPRVNLLPPEIGERARFRRIQYGLGSGVAASLGIVALLFVGATAAVSSANEELDVANAQNAQLRTQTAQYAEVNAVYARAAAAQAMLTTAMGQEIRYSQFLNDLSLSVPENVWVRSVTFTQTDVPPAVGEAEPGVGTVTISGVGFSHDDVALWLESLASQRGYTNPYFSSSAESLIGTRPVVNYDSTATLTSDALSGRYAAPVGG